jgi:hypothetical protein
MWNCDNNSVLLCFRPLKLPHLKALVKDKYLPFYLKWVSDCYSFLNEPDSVVLKPEQTNRFQKYLAETHEYWQVKQAINALRLYKNLQFSFKSHSFFHFINDKFTKREGGGECG